VNLQGYRNAVGSPLDLRIIQQKLESCEYHKADECLNDLDAMFSGCREYFKPGSVRSSNLYVLGCAYVIGK